METKELIKQIEKSFDFSRSQIKIQNDVRAIIALVYRLSETGRNVTESEEDKEYWNNLRRLLYEALNL